jgi:hypothetical protein
MSYVAPTGEHFPSHIKHSTIRTSRTFYRRWSNR